MACAGGTARGGGFGRVAAVYLLGLLLGGVYVGLIAPLRTAIQAQMGIGDSLGIWMVNAYTLFYAALIPISASLADRYGRKRVYTACLAIFTAGAALCGLSQDVGGFPLLIAGRVVQAAGAGGIIPVATAEMGVSAPEGKRGMWLGIASAVAGIANVAGAALGSAVLAAVGAGNWRWAFWGAVPLGALLALAAARVLPGAAEGAGAQGTDGRAGSAAAAARDAAAQSQGQAGARGRLDLLGSALFVAFVLALLFGLGGIDFFHPASLASPRVWGSLLAAAALAWLFARAERRAASPVLHMEYLSDGRIRVLMAVSFLVGCSIISMVLIPQFAEAALGAPVGSGGYYMAVIGVFAAFGPPLAGKLIDRRGAKPVLVGGLLVTAAGFALLALAVAPRPSTAGMLAALGVVGLGMGFTMGTPLNYLILQSVPKSQSASGVAALALVRQMGTTVAPALLVGFVSSGGGMAGYQAMLLCVAAFNLASAALMGPFREKPAEGKGQG